uniref:Uncharacterized protein n=1 Tax=Arundo donax TaxID=35708 RepID=A0A0A9GPC6_ARUDO
MCCTLNQKANNQHRKQMCSQA